MWTDPSLGRELGPPASQQDKRIWKPHQSTSRRPHRRWLGSSEVEEREDDCPHLCDCFYHRPLHRALPPAPSQLREPLPPSCPPPRRHLPWCMPRGPSLLSFFMWNAARSCCPASAPCLPREHLGLQKRAGLWLHFRGRRVGWRRPRA